jgi:threonine/homoserine/homoserine lactone efflux protein
VPQPPDLAAHSIAPAHSLWARPRPSPHPAFSQACSAATLAPCSAVILTGLLLAGNSPDTPLLTPTLYWVVLLAAMCDMAAALHLALRRAREERLRDERRRHRLAAAAAGAAATEP